MNEQAIQFRAPNPGVRFADFEDFCAAYRQRRDALSLIKQLNQMIKAVQRHRGMSMALLAGSSHFQGDFDILQCQVERRLASLEVFAAQTNGLLSHRDKVNLHNAWSTIRADWQGDDVIDNFELHSHFIDQLQIMISGLAKFLEKPVSVIVAEKANLELPDEDATAYPKMFKQIELLNFAARQVTTMAEQIGRIRALATYAAAKGICDDHHNRKLRYAISTARAANEKLRHQAERLEYVLAGALPSLTMIKTYELKLMFLFNIVEADVLSGAAINTTSHNLFKLATEIIDVYLKVVDESMDLISRWNDEDLEGWLCLV
ncbi:lytic murein transglycosylase [Saccharophagus sp. K07]|jgi:hypothetical protein|uniref:lytic murein transglycosylase n=1 Tax=Saccharophagus sp. K07 TaxID=2283636 RepID=UPI001651DAB6|nr:lytic murein transglycosylase [Saccharophagus sp. K07]MBC6906629.1 lytic murein transglycosylase [Saccharophagus sp. K07]